MIRRTRLDRTSPVQSSPDHVLTIFIQEELIKAQAAGLLPDETVHVLSAVVMDGNGVLQRLDARLQAERDLGVSHRVSATDGESVKGCDYRRSDSDHSSTTQ